jgi:multimeric flavodoxin WrbA
VYAELLDATAIILATPIYWFSVSAQMKLFIDRFYAFHTSEEYVFKEKPMAAVLVYGDKDPYNSGAVNAIYALKSMFKYNQAKFRKIIYGNAGKAGGVRENTSFMEDALKLGENMRVFLNP